MRRDAATVLHIAPEAALRRRFEAIPGVTYICGDLTAEYGDLEIDVTALQFPDASIDFVVCNHVLEHVPDDFRAMREIRRVLKPGGWALLQVPDLWDEETIEDPSATDPAYRARRFGQSDHVRRYGWDFTKRLEGAGFSVRVGRLEDELEERLITRYALLRGGRTDPMVVGWAI